MSYNFFTCGQPVIGQCTDTSYQAAFKHVVQRLKGTHGLTNVQFVFHVMYGALDAPCLYPGDDVVDVIGVSFFEGAHDDCYRKGADCINSNVEATLAWAALHAPSKPLFFPESTPQDLTAGDATWPTQFVSHIHAAVAKYDVRYWTYINMDWNAHGWGQGWGDSRVQATPAVLELWKQQVLGDARYLCIGGSPCGKHQRPFSLHE